MVKIDDGGIGGGGGEVVGLVEKVEGVDGEGDGEVNGIGWVKDESVVKNGRIYVRLEACCDYGKSGGCGELMIGKGIGRVVVGCVEGFCLVGGRGMEKLGDGGIKVRVGVLEKEWGEVIGGLVRLKVKKGG